MNGRWDEGGLHAGYQRTLRVKKRLNQILDNEDKVTVGKDVGRRKGAPRRFSPVLTVRQVDEGQAAGSRERIRARRLGKGKPASIKGSGGEVLENARGTSVGDCFLDTQTTIPCPVLGLATVPVNRGWE